METFDLVIVGGGVAGLCAALAAPDGARIAVIDKGEDRAGSSPLAQGGLAAAVGPADSIDLHIQDTLKAGAGLCDESIVQNICAEGPDAIDWLGKLGCAFDRDDRGEIHLAREGGQTVARSVHWRDNTGAEIVRALRAAARGRARRIDAKAISLITGDGHCTGVETEIGPVYGGSTLLATGGAGSLWASTTNAPGATGDGIVLAMAAGVLVADLELMQFHPTALNAGGTQRVLLTEALRGDGALLVNQDGQRFVDELAPRDVVAKAILAQHKAFLDCRALKDLRTRYPTILEGAARHGFDAQTQLLPVAPAAHYFIGGVASDVRGGTGMPGLYAAGECASTGMHGANRMAGNSLLEAVVVGRRVGAQTVRYAVAKNEPQVPQAMRDATPDQALRTIMWEHCGPIRDGISLQEGRDALTPFLSTPHGALCDAIIAAAAARAETRGVHVRSDHPDPVDAYARRYLVMRKIREA